MEQVIISTSKTENGFSASCELLPGWIVAFTGSFSEFVNYVKESIDFYVDCAKTDQDPYPTVFDNDYELLFKMDIQSLLYCYDKILTRGFTTERICLWLCCSRARSALCGCTVCLSALQNCPRWAIVTQASLPR